MASKKLSPFDPLGHHTHPEDAAAIKDLANKCWLKTIVTGNHPTAIEVGCWAGATTIVLADLGFRVLAVDHWLGNPYDPLLLEKQGMEPEKVFFTFCKNVGSRLFSSVFPLSGVSDLWSWAVRDARLQADLIFIDAGHTYNDAHLDIFNWLRSLRPGGLMLVHDYCKEFPGVVKAVRELLPGFQVAGKSVAWKEKE